MTSQSMYASQSKSLESNTLLSVEEIEEKIQQLITENTGLRSMFLLFLPFKICVTHFIIPLLTSQIHYSRITPI